MLTRLHTEAKVAVVHATASQGITVDLLCFSKWHFSRIDLLLLLCCLSADGLNLFQALGFNDTIVGEVKPAALSTKTCHSQVDTLAV